MAGNQDFSPEVTCKGDLVDDMAQGCCLSEDWRIGTEHEKFVYCARTLRPLPYFGEKSIQRVLNEFQKDFGWDPLYEDGNLIALKKDQASITLEPGGQLELSGAPLQTLHQTCRETHDHLNQVKQIAGPLGIGMLGMGFTPRWRADDVTWMPKGRYRIMRDYMQTRGKLGTSMMARTCTVQVNLDFADEADMVQKFRLSLALQPIATALFSNSPFTEGTPNGFQSWRSHIWTDTDPDRCGVPAFVFEPGMGFERYVDYMLDVPMYFVEREGRYLDASGRSFRDYMAGKLDILPGQRPTLKDWEDHLTTAFPEVRMKKYLEMRGADGGPWKNICALPAFWVGLLYDATARDAAWDIVRHWTQADHDQLRRDVPRLALSAEVAGKTVHNLARALLDIAAQGLRNRARRDQLGQDETKFLAPLRTIVESGKTEAQIKLDRYFSDWQNSVDPIFTDCAY